MSGVTEASTSAAAFSSLRLPYRYAKPDGRKNVSRSWNPIELLKSPSWITLVALVVLIAVLRGYRGIHLGGSFQFLTSKVHPHQRKTGGSIAPNPHRQHIESIDETLPEDEDITLMVERWKGLVGGSYLGRYGLSYDVQRQSNRSR